jgi:hypothetical protein
MPSSILRIIAKSPNSARIIVISPAGVGWYLCLSDLAADGDGTVMSWDWQARSKGWMRMLGPLFGPLGGRMERRIWTSMKRYLENAPARPVTRPTP